MLCWKIFSLLYESVLVLILKTFNIISIYLYFDYLDSIESKSILLLIVWSIALNEIYKNNLNIDYKSTVKNWTECFQWKIFKKEYLSSVLKIIKD